MARRPTLAEARSGQQPQEDTTAVGSGEIRAEVAEVSIELAGSEVQSASEWTEGAQLKKVREGNTERVTIEVPVELAGALIVEGIPATI